MKPGVVDNVVIDVGGVLIDWDPRHLYRKIFSDTNEMEYFLREVCTPEWHEQHDRGVPIESTTAALVAAHPEFTSEIHAYGERYSEMWEGAIEQSVVLLRQLQQRGYRTYVATNWSNEFWPLAIRDFPFLTSFDGALVSGDIGICKPAREFFVHLVERFLLEPRRTLYIDDSITNVEMAAALGFIVHQYGSPHELANALAALGLL